MPLTNERDAKRHEFIYTIHINSVVRLLLLYLLQYPNLLSEVPRIANESGVVSVLRRNFAQLAGVANDFK